ncbi:hypothetical protein N7G274_003424 [Stereocaulon virgatum]|uniref:Uncharacterized protein n=1 Tax=Stereocaulon virgatum TaxID=373712 RepID=A0ABR4ADJ5_9LECA
MFSIGLNLAYKLPHVLQRQPRRSVAPSTTSHLFRIPRELRDEIYTYALVDPSGPIRDYKSVNDQRPNTDFISSHALLSTCRQIRTEAYNIYFGKNTFFFARYSHLDSFLKDLGQEGRLVITSLTLDIEHFFEGQYPIMRNPLEIPDSRERKLLFATSRNLVGCQKLRSINFVGHVPSSWATKLRLVMIFHKLCGLEEFNVDEELQFNGGLRPHRRFRILHVDQNDARNQHSNLQEIELVRNWLLQPHL